MSFHFRVLSTAHTPAEREAPKQQHIPICRHQAWRSPGKHRAASTGKQKEQGSLTCQLSPLKSRSQVCLQCRISNLDNVFESLHLAKEMCPEGGGGEQPPQLPVTTEGHRGSFASCAHTGICSPFLYENTNQEGFQLPSHVTKVVGR